MRRLQEADKSRFIKPIWSALETETDLKDIVHHLSICGLKPVPDEKEIINFVNSGAVDNFKIDWNTFKTRYTDRDELIQKAVELVNAYIQWYINKQVKAERKATIVNFRKEISNTNKYKIIEEIGSWIFVAPLCYEAAMFMDSHMCGGAGARWCIGYKESNEAWLDYTGQRQHAFVLAIDIDKWGSETDLKYMIEFGANSGKFLQAWTQDDEIEHTINSAEKFNSRILKNIVDVQDIVTVAKEEIKDKLETGTNIVRFTEGGKPWLASDSTIYIVPCGGDKVDLESIYLSCTNKEIIKEFVIKGTREGNTFDDRKLLVDSDVLDLHQLLIYSRARRRKDIVLPPLNIEDFKSAHIDEVYVDYDKLIYPRAVFGFVPLDIYQLTVYDGQMIAEEDYMSLDYYLQEGLFDQSKVAIQKFKMSPYGSYKNDIDKKDICTDESYYLDAFSEDVSGMTPGDSITLDFSSVESWGSYNLDQKFLKYIERNFEENEFTRSKIRVMNADLQELIIPFGLKAYNIELRFVNCKIGKLTLKNKTDITNVYGDFSKKKEKKCGN